MFLQSSPLSSSVVRMEFGREVFHDGLEPLDASRLAQGEKSLLRDSCFSHLEARNSGKTETWKTARVRQLKIVENKIFLIISY